MKCPICDGMGTSNTCVNGTFKPCSFCDGTGEVQICEMGFIGKDECDKCNGTGYVEMTNEEYLKSLDTEQLAEWLQEHMDCASCGCNKDLCYQGYDCCKLAFVEWLKQPHRDTK